MAEPKTSVTPPREPREPHETIVESMLERPVAEIVRFVMRCVRLWLTALVVPWRVGAAAIERNEKLPPPFAWLVLTLFAAGVSLRVFFSVEAAPALVEEGFADDLRRAWGEVSLTHAVMVTFPCVLVCALAARLASRICGGAPRLLEDDIVRNACYALGWQAGLAAVAFVVPIGMELLGMEPTGRWNVAFNQSLLVLVTLGGLWGGLLLGPAVASRMKMPLTIRAPLGFGGAVLVSAPIAMVSFWLLGQSVDLRAAAAIADARQQRAWFGELDVDVLETCAVRTLDGEPRLAVTIAYTSRSDRLLIAPRVELLKPADGGATLAVIDSSLDYLPDRAVLIEPGGTRVAEYTLESTGPAISAAEAAKPGGYAYDIPFHRREADGGFEQGVAKLYLPRRELVASFGPTTQRR